MATKPEDKSWIVFFIFPLLVVIFEILGLVAARSAVEHYRLERRGRITDGTAFFSEYKQGGKSGGAYYVRYVFECNGVRYKGEWRTSKAWVPANKLPMRIRVRFLPDDPTFNWPPDVGVRTPLPVKALVLLLCLGAGVYFGARVVLAWRRSGSRWSPLGLGLTAGKLAVDGAGAV